MEPGVWGGGEAVGEGGQFEGGADAGALDVYFEGAVSAEEGLGGEGSGADVVFGDWVGGDDWGRQAGRGREAGGGEVGEVGADAEGAAGGGEVDAADCGVEGGEGEGVEEGVADGGGYCVEGRGGEGFSGHRCGE